VLRLGDPRRVGAGFQNADVGTRFHDQLAERHVRVAAGELAVGREIAAIKARLQRMNPEEDQAGYGRMFGELVALEQRKKWLLDRATGA